MNKINKNSKDEPFWVTHPEYYPDGPKTHLKKQNLTGWKATVALTFVIGCGLLLGIMILFFFTEVVFTEKIFYAIPFFVFFCFILGLWNGSQKSEDEKNKLRAKRLAANRLKNKSKKSKIQDREK
ncbi:MAG: hypothetical protein PHR53_09525 [Bacteroidales bacterium]|nr:hypothetical protein [Bacteroidales bacterium]